MSIIEQVEELFHLEKKLSKCVPDGWTYQETQRKIAGARDALAKIEYLAAIGLAVVKMKSNTALTCEGEHDLGAEYGNFYTLHDNATCTLIGEGTAEEALGIVKAATA